MELQHSGNSIAPSRFSSLAAPADLFESAFPITGFLGDAARHVTRSVIVQTPDGKTRALSLDAARDRYIAHAYVETVFAAQGRTADHVFIHAHSKATNLVDQKSFHVGISLDKEAATIFTNYCGKLMSALCERAGHLQPAIAQAAIPTPTAKMVAGSGLG